MENYFFIIGSNLIWRGKAEGASRNHNKEFIQFLYISLSSASEIETQILISYNLKYIIEDEFKVIENRIVEIRKLINGLIKSIKY